MVTEENEFFPCSQLLQVVIKGSNTSRANTSSVDKLQKQCSSEHRH
jgi:hypothetical protein